MSAGKWQDKNMEVIIGNLLRGGVMTAMGIVLVGGIIYLFRHGNQLPQYGSFRGEPENFRTLGGIFSSVLHGRGRGVIQLGILVLIATPISRVAFSIIGYLLEKDYLYVAITFVVLCIIIGSLLSGVAG